MLWLMATLWSASPALASDIPIGEAPVVEMAVLAAPTREPVSRYPQRSFRLGTAPALLPWMHRAADRVEQSAPVGADGPPAREKSGRRSRNLLLGSLVAEAAAGALLAGAALTHDAYLDPANDPGRGLYRANRVLGHAGYASAVAGGALVLGSVSLGEW